MNKQDVVNFLKDKKGYLKKGNQWIADKLGISLSLATECKKTVAADVYQIDKNSIKEFTNENINEIDDKGFKKHLSNIGLNLENVKSVKFWQTSKGDHRYSVVPLNGWHLGLCRRRPNMDNFVRLQKPFAARPSIHITRSRLMYQRS